MCLVRLASDLLSVLSSHWSVTYRCLGLPCWSPLQWCLMRRIIGNKWHAFVYRLLSSLILPLGPWTCIVLLDDWSWSLEASPLYWTLGSHSGFTSCVVNMSPCWNIQPFMTYGVINCLWVQSLMYNTLCIFWSHMQYAILSTMVNHDLSTNKNKNQPSGYTFIAPFC